MQFNKFVSSRSFSEFPLLFLTYADDFSPFRSFIFSLISSCIFSGIKKSKQLRISLNYGFSRLLLYTKLSFRIHMWQREKMEIDSETILRAAFLSWSKYRYLTQQNFFFSLPRSIRFVVTIEFVVVCWLLQIGPVSRKKCVFLY